MKKTSFIFGILFSCALILKSTLFGSWPNVETTDSEQQLPKGYVQKIWATMLEVNSQQDQDIRALKAEVSELRRVLGLVVQEVQKNSQGLSEIALQADSTMELESHATWRDDQRSQIRNLQEEQAKQRKEFWSGRQQRRSQMQQQREGWETRLKELEQRFKPLPENAGSFPAFNPGMSASAKPSKQRVKRA